MKVSAVIPTRGNVDMRPVVESLACFDEVLIWDNSVQQDLGVYGRYAMIEKARNDLVFTQDDDVIVSDPQAVVEGWLNGAARPGPGITRPDGTAFVNVGIEVDHLCANMPAEFRHDGYTDSCLVGFGACFHRDLPERSFSRLDHRVRGIASTNKWFNRTCDVVFTTLTPRVLVDVPKTDREFASDPDRMWRQPGHVGERTMMLEIARKVRDA